MSGPVAFEADRAAAALLAARRGRRAALVPLGDGVHPGRLDEGIAAQVALAGMLGAARPAGFKIGATAKRMQIVFGAVGACGRVHGGGGAARVGQHAGVGAVLPAGGGVRAGGGAGAGSGAGPCSAEAAREAVAEVLPAIELVENRYADLAAFGAPAMVADQVFHAAAVIGDAQADWRELDLLGLRGTLSVDGVVRGEGEGRELLGGPFEALAWLAGSAEAAAFGGLRAGQVVMLGSVCPPVWLEGPGTITASLGELGTVSVTLLAGSS